jgi:type I restriction enzyme S subunit
LGWVRATTADNFPVDQLLDYEIDLPVLEEQRRIAAILDQADEVRTQKRRLRDAVVTLRMSIFADTFGTTEATTTLGECGEVQGGLQVSAKRSGLPLELPYLRVANVYRSRLDLTEVKMIRANEAEAARTRLEPGDLLFVEGHANPNEVGRAALWDGSIPNCVHQNHLIRVRLNRKMLLPEFAVTWFNSTAGAKHFRQSGKTTSGLNTISASEVRSAPTPIPPINEQQEFSRLVRKVGSLTDDYDSSIALADRLFSSLQSRAFAGQL